MSKTKKQIEQELQEKALVVINAQRDLEQSEAFKSFIKEQKRIADLWKDLKTTIKSEMLKQGIDNISSVNGKSDWDISIIHRKSAQVTDLSQVEDEYFEETELKENEVVVHDGKIFLRTPNNQLAKNNLVLGVNVDGFELVDTPAISIKVDGKAV